MKTIGLIGGMSWESSHEYYKLINQYTNKALGKLHSSKNIVYSVDFQEIVEHQEKGEWEEVAKLLSNAAQSLEKAGADFVIICANTVHKVAEQVQEKINIPLLHIIDVTAQAIKDQNLNTIALLGTKYTMQQEFYKKRLLEKHSIKTIIPNEEEMDFIHKVIHDEVALGKINFQSKERLKKIINRLAKEGAQGAILGCTEIPLVLKPGNMDFPLFDTLELHAKAAVEYVTRDQN